MENIDKASTNEITCRAEPRQIGEDALEWAFNQGLANRDFVVKEIDGERYTNFSGLKRIAPYEADPAPPFTAFSLKGLCDWINADVDGNVQKYGHLFVHVLDERNVLVKSKVSGKEGNRRELLAKCEFPFHPFPWGRYMDQESFIVMLLSRFTEDAQGVRDIVGKLVGNITQEQSANAADDGVSQKVSVKHGLSMVGETTVKNPVYLSPMRTFCEIAQPVSPFVLRVAEGPQIALFEADDGAWKNEAVERIAQYLANMLKPITSERVTVIA